MNERSQSLWNCLVLAIVAIVIGLAFRDGRHLLPNDDTGRPWLRSHLNYAWPGS